MDAEKLEIGICDDSIYDLERIQTVFLPVHRRTWIFAKREYFSLHILQWNCYGYR